MDLFETEPRRSDDPDVDAVIRAHGDLVDPYEIVRVKAELLLQKYADFEDGAIEPLTRMKAIASLAGLPVREGNSKALSSKGRAAMFVPRSADGTGYIVYDPELPTSRVIFSIGHEIAHSFFPTSNAGVRFRSSHSPSSKPGRQLEMLCEFGAAQLAMPTDEIRVAMRQHGFSFQAVNAVRHRFGTSFEATTYRMAQTATFGAAAAKLQFRFSKKDLRTEPAAGLLFPEPLVDSVRPKYRVQSFHASTAFPGRIPFNKSFPEDSCVYRIPIKEGPQRAIELISVTSARSVRVQVEAIRAPFQPEGTDPDHPDVLLLLRVVVN